MGEDKRLERLFDYTKFHIGVYLTMAGGLMAVLNASLTGKPEELKGFVGNPLALSVGILLLGIAGFAGGIIASSATQCQSWQELWGQRQGPYRSKVFTGESWAAIEHTSFWMSVLVTAFAFLWGKW